jgi:hypothetical protein
MEMRVWAHHPAEKCNFHQELEQRARTTHAGGSNVNDIETKRREPSIMGIFAKSK